MLNGGEVQRGEQKKNGPQRSSFHPLPIVAFFVGGWAAGPISAAAARSPTRPRRPARGCPRCRCRQADRRRPSRSALPLSACDRGLGRARTCRRRRWHRRPRGVDARSWTGSNDSKGSTASSSGADMEQRYRRACRARSWASDYHAAVPEGEAIHRTAAALRTALVGRAVLSFEAPYLDGPVPATGRVIELVESRGWQLDMVWDDGLILHTNLLLGGAWHLYRAGERWRKPSSQLRVGLTVDGFSAVCFGARTVETYREFDTHRHPGFGPAGPDLCAASPDLDAAIEALCGYDDFDAPIAEVLLDQQVARGVGNVFRSEVLWACQQHPFAPVSMLSRADIQRVIKIAAEVLHAHLHPRSRGDPRRAPRTRGVRAQRPTLPALRRHGRGATPRRAEPVALLVPRLPSASWPTVSSRVGRQSAHGSRIPRQRSSLPNYRGGAATRWLAERQRR